MMVGKVTPFVLGLRGTDGADAGAARSLARCKATARASRWTSFLAVTAWAWIRRASSKLSWKAKCKISWFFLENLSPNQRSDEHITSTNHIHKSEGGRGFPPQAVQPVLLPLRIIKVKTWMDSQPRVWVVVIRDATLESPTLQAFIESMYFYKLHLEPLDRKGMCDTTFWRYKALQVEWGHRWSTVKWNYMCWPNRWHAGVLQACWDLLRNLSGSFQ